MTVQDQYVLKVTGLRDFQAALRAMDGESQKMIRQALNESADLVVEAAQRRAPVRTGRLRNSIRAASTQRLAQVKEGGAFVPYAGFIDYGGTVGRARNTRERRRARREGRASVGAVRKFIPTGRILYPAFLSQEKQINAQMQASLLRLAKGAGVAVNSDALQ